MALTHGSCPDCSADLVVCRLNLTEAMLVCSQCTFPLEHDGLADLIGPWSPTGSFATPYKAAPTPRAHSRTISRLQVQTPVPFSCDSAAHASSVSLKTVPGSEPHSSPASPVPGTSPPSPSASPPAPSDGAGLNTLLQAIMKTTDVDDEADYKAFVQSFESIF